jgi:probable phosphoglycerate mutase
VKPVTVRLILIRHGQVEANRSYRYLGRRDDPLDATGREQALAVAGAMRQLPVDLVLTSPSSRARATAEGLARPGVVVRNEARLRELDFGTWEGLSRAEVLARSADDAAFLQAWESDPSVAPPEGESLESLRERVVELADELARTAGGATVALVSHMGPIKVLLCAALDLPLRRTGRIFLDPATISVVDWGPRPVVRLVNSHAHLGFDRARWLEQP